MKDLLLCEGKGHKEHYGKLWKCKGCRGSFCYNEGTDDDFLPYCDECALIIEIESTNI